MHPRLRLTLTLVVPLALAIGCSTPGGFGDDRPRTTATASSPIAYARGTAVYLEDLRRPLLGAAGGQALADWVLDRELARELLSRGLEVTGADVEAQRRAMLEMLSPDEDEAARLLRELREERGLDEASFDAFMRRSAVLRKLVGEVEVSDAAVTQAYELRHGPRYAVRLLVATSLTQAQRLRERAMAGAAFAELANEAGVRAVEGGGVLDPMSAADPSVPRAVAAVLPQLRAGDVSDALAVEGGFALVKLERVVPADAQPLERARPELERLVRLRVQRVRMAELARELVTGAGVRVLDPTLERSWARQAGTRIGER